MIYSSAYRRKCLTEHGHQCKLCDGDTDIVAHHIDGDRSNDDLDNLMPVCQGCHAKIHSGSAGYEEWFEKLHPSSQRGLGGSIKEERSTVNVYLPVPLREKLDQQYRDLRYGLGDDFHKGRHYHLLLFSLGLEHIETMSLSETKKELERIDGAAQEE